MAMPAMTPQEFVEAVRAIPAPAPALPAVSRLQSLLDARNETLFPGPARDGSLPGQLLATNAEAFVGSFRGFMQSAAGVMRAYSSLPAADQAVLLANHDPWPDALPASPLSAVEDAHLLIFLQRATIDLDSGILSSAIASYPSEGPADVVTQGRRLLAHIVAQGTRLCTAQNLPAQKWRDTLRTGHEIVSRSPPAHSVLLNWAAVASLAAASYLKESPGQAAAIKHDVWSLTQSLHRDMGVAVTAYATTTAPALLRNVVEYAERMLAISYNNGTGFLVEQPYAVGLAAVDDSATSATVALAAEVRHLQDQVHELRQQPAQQQQSWQPREHEQWQPQQWQPQQWQQQQHQWQQQQWAPTPQWHQQQQQQWAQPWPGQQHGQQQWHGQQQQWHGQQQQWHGQP